MSILNVNKINPVGGGSTITIAGIASVTNNISVGNSVTANAFYGDGSNLTGISVDSTKIETGNTKVETVDTGSDGHVKVTTEGSERVRITSGGSVLVGKTATSLTTDGIRMDSNAAIITASSTSTNQATANGGSLYLINSSATDNNFSHIGGYNSNGLVTSQINFVNTSHSSRTGDISFRTHDGSSMPERMRISSQGHVTKPAHPCFDVVRSGGHVTSGNYIIYNTVNVNNGSHYNSGNGKFTAPVAGHYFFSYGTIKNTSAVTRLYFRKNGSNFPTGADRHLRMDSDQNYGDNGAMTIVVNLAVGDEIQIYIGQGEVYGTTQEYCYFNGYLIG